MKSFVLVQNFPLRAAAITTSDTHSLPGVYPDNRPVALRDGLTALYCTPQTVQVCEVLRPQRACTTCRFGAASLLERVFAQLHLCCLLDAGHTTGDKHGLLTCLKYHLASVQCCWSCLVGSSSWLQQFSRTHRECPMLQPAPGQHAAPMQQWIW
jgi:hypothetical protein